MKDVTIVLGVISLLSAFIIGVAMLVVKYDPPRPLPCAKFADVPREHTPARCFDDYRGNRP